MKVPRSKLLESAEAKAASMASSNDGMKFVSPVLASAHGSLHITMGVVSEAAK